MAIAYPPLVEKIEYPCSDGKPMAESDVQRHYLLYSVEALRLYFQNRPDVYTSGNLFIYYEEGNPQAVVAPDVFVVFGTAKHDRPSYRLWQEPKGPDFVLEITSRSSRSQDQGPKRGTYAFLGVREYFLYDPTGDYLKPQLQGFRLQDDNYYALPAITSADDVVACHSAVLGLDLRLTHGVLRFYDATTGQTLLSPEEMEQARQAAEQARQTAEQARQAAEQARQAAEQAQRTAEEHASREAAARRTAEARIAELEARLREQGK